jgi:hypothetical protein
MRISLSSMAPTVMAAVLFAALAYPLMTAVDATTCKGHMQSADPTQVCYDHFGGRQRQVQDDSAALLAEAQATGGRTCYRPADIPKGLVPSWAVMRRLDGTVSGMPFAQAWMLATTGNAWTITVCQ